MRHFFLIMIIIVNTLNARPRHIDRFDTLSNYSVISTFSHFGFNQEWQKGSWSTYDSAYDTVYNRQNAITIQSFNGSRTAIDKPLLPPQDFSSWGLIGLKCKPANKDSLIILYLSTNNFKGGFRSEFKVTYTIEDLREYTIIFPRSSFSSFGTGGNWSIIDKIRITYIAKKGTYNYLTCTKLYVQNSSLLKSSIMLTFDGGYISQLDSACPTMNLYGIKATFCYTTNWHGEKNIMTVSELLKLKSFGNEICSHSMSHPSFYKISPNQIEYEIRGAQHWLDSNKISTKRSKDIIIYPYGHIPDTLRNRILPYHSIGISVENIPGRWMTTPVYDQLSIPRHMTYPTMTWSNLRGKIDLAIKYKWPMMIGFHSISGDDQISPHRWGKKEFDSLCFYIDSLRDVGLCDIPLVSEYFKYAPDSCIIPKNRDSTINSFTLDDSLSTDADSMKMFLYDSSYGAWTLVDSTTMLPGGALFSFTRDNLSVHTKYYFRTIGYSNSGTYDSMSQIDSITTLDLVYIENNGYIGIGTPYPQALLDIRNGGVNIQGKLQFTDIYGNPYVDQWIGVTNNILNNSEWFYLGGITSMGVKRICLGGLVYIPDSLCIGTPEPKSKLQVIGIQEYQNNDAAKNAGLTEGAFYRTGDILKIVH